MMTNPVDTLKALRIGVEMDAAYDPEGPAKLKALDAAIAVLSGGEAVAKSLAHHRKGEGGDVTTSLLGGKELG